MSTCPCCTLRPGRFIGRFLRRRPSARVLPRRREHGDSSMTPRRRRLLAGGSGGTHEAPVLSIDGQFFRDRGERWTAIETSEFSLLRRYLDGENVRPLLAERAAFGFNLLRVWLLNQGVVGNRDGRNDEGIHPDL